MQALVLGRPAEVQGPGGGARPERASRWRVRTGWREWGPSLMAPVSRRDASYPAQGPARFRRQAKTTKTLSQSAPLPFVRGPAPLVARDRCRASAPLSMSLGVPVAAGSCSRHGWQSCGAPALFWRALMWRCCNCRSRHASTTGGRDLTESVHAVKGSRFRWRPARSPSRATGCGSHQGLGLP